MSSLLAWTGIAETLSGFSISQLGAFGLLLEDHSRALDGLAVDGHWRMEGLGDVFLSAELNEAEASARAAVVVIQDVGLVDGAELREYLEQFVFVARAGQAFDENLPPLQIFVLLVDIDAFFEGLDVDLGQTPAYLSSVDHVLEAEDLLRHRLVCELEKTEAQSLFGFLVPGQLEV